MIGVRGEARVKVITGYSENQLFEPLLTITSSSVSLMTQMDVGVRID